MDERFADTDNEVAFLNVWNLFKNIEDFDSAYELRMKFTHFREKF